MSNTHARALDALEVLAVEVEFSHFGWANSIREALAALSAPAAVAGWQPIETAPKDGEFLLGVWEGEWRKPKQRFRVYHATGHDNGPSWAMRGSYRTEEGGAYEVAGWMPLPTAPKPSPEGQS